MDGRVSELTVGGVLGYHAKRLGTTLPLQHGGISPSIVSCPHASLAGCSQASERDALSRFR